MNQEELPAYSTNNSPQKNIIRLMLKKTFFMTNPPSYSPCKIEVTSLSTNVALLTIKTSRPSVQISPKPALGNWDCRSDANQFHYNEILPLTPLSDKNVFIRCPVNASRGKMLQQRRPACSIASFNSAASRIQCSRMAHP